MVQVESLKFRLGEETQRRQQLEEAEAKRPDNSELFKTLQSKVLQPHDHQQADTSLTFDGTIVCLVSCRCRSRSVC